MLSNTILFIGLLSLGSPVLPTSDQAFNILQQNCGNESCHGGPDAYRFDVGNPSTLVDAGVVKPGRSADSEVIRRVEAGIMPLGGYKGRSGTKLPPEDIRILREWIDAGAPVPAGDSAASRRPFVSESQILGAILNDLQSAHEADRPYLRYFALANLWNSPDVQDSDIEVARAALRKLANHLCWQREIVKPTTLGPQSLVFRVDLREY